MPTAFARMLLSAGIAALLCGCGGGAMHATPPTNSSGPSGTTEVTLRIDPPSTNPSNNTRRAQYISPATQSLVYVISFEGSPIGGGTGYVNITPGSPYCSSPGALQPLTCSVLLPIAPSLSGDYTFDLWTYDRTQSAQCSPPTVACAGQLLSSAVVAQTIATGENNVVSLTLGGIPASVAVAPLTPGYLQAGPNGASLRLWGASAQQLVVEARDADGNTIVGSGAPTLSVTSSDTSAVGVTAATAAAPNVFTLQAVTSGSPAVVTPESLALTVSATPATGSGSTTPLTQTIPLRLAHSAVYIADDDYGYDYGTILVYYDANTTAPNVTLSAENGLVNVTSVAVDASGRLFVGNFGDASSDPVNSGGVDIYDTPVSTASVPVASAFASEGNSSLAAVEGVAVDRVGKLYALADWNPDVSVGTLSIYAPGNANPILGGPSDPFGDPMAAIAVTPDGAIDAINSALGTIDEFLPGETTQNAEITSGLGFPVRVGVDGAGNLYVADYERGLVVYDAGTLVPDAALSLFLPNAVAVAVDASGTAFIAACRDDACDDDGAYFAVQEYRRSGAGWTLAATLPLPGTRDGNPVGIAVVPSAVSQ